MRIAFISDIHGNLEALEAVLADVRQQACGMIWCLGDVVGYGPSPNECCQMLRSAGIPSLKGNHEALVTMAAPLPEGLLSPLAFQSLKWTRQQLSRENALWLAGLPYVHEMPEIETALAHATFNSPEEFEYVSTVRDAERSFKGQPQRMGFIGHTHEPKLFRMDPVGQTLCSLSVQEFTITDACRYLINVGSVGQPRDRDPRSSYVIWNGEARNLQPRRVIYPISVTQEKIRAAALPERLAARLDLAR